MHGGARAVSSSSQAVIREKYEYFRTIDCDRGTARSRKDLLSRRAQAFSVVRPKYNWILLTPSAQYLRCHLAHRGGVLSRFIKTVMNHLGLSIGLPLENVPG